MSFIFEALKKHDDNAPKVIPADNGQVLNSPQQSGQQAFSWGLLLALAILGAVIIGFILGRMSVPVSEKRQLTVSQQTATQLVDALGPKVSAIQIPVIPAKVEEQAAIPSQKIAAEDYFDNPPAKEQVKAEEALAQTQTQAQVQARAQAPEFGLPPVVEQTEIKAESEAKASVSQLEAAEGVSDELLKRFQQAVADEAQVAPTEPTESAQASVIPPLHEQPQWVQDSVPRLNFSMHIYSSKSQDSWIRVNGQDKFVGDTIGQNIRLTAIEPQHVILELDGEQFSLPALSTW